jgi:hypothetical protein
MDPTDDVTTPAVGVTTPPAKGVFHRTLNPIFTGAQVKSRSLSETIHDNQTSGESHDLAAIKTYRYLRIGMLAAVLALAYSVFEEYRKPGVGCFLGSLSGYYYTPVHSVFISVMVAIGLALIVIKGQTALEDAFLSLAGMMAPIVAFLPTDDDSGANCRPKLLLAHDYTPAVLKNIPKGAYNFGFDPQFIKDSEENNLHALVIAGFAALGLLAIGIGLQWWRSKRKKATMTEYTTGTKVNLIGGAIVVFIVFLLVWFDYDWVRNQHPIAAGALFLFIALAALTNSVVGWKRSRLYGFYLAVAVVMIVAGFLFLIVYHWKRSALDGYLDLVIETVGFGFFFIYWGFQTVERWSETVLPKSELRAPREHK